MSERAAFDSALFYATDNDGSDGLSHSTAEDAIDNYLVDSPKGTSIRCAIEARSPLTVFGYIRTPIPDSFFESAAKSTAEHFARTFEEDDRFSGDEGPFFRVKRTDFIAALATDLLPILKARKDQMVPYLCQVCGQRDYSAEELLAMYKHEIEEEESDA